MPAATLKPLLAAPNQHGKPNADVMRRVIGANAGERWIVDFPTDCTAAEAALFEKPFNWLGDRLVGESTHFWQNSDANQALRAALARLTRYLATPRNGAPAWEWIDSELLPDDSLLVVPRDDDFAHGLLSSHWFGLWWTKCNDAAAPENAILSFPFPWISEEQGRLTREQEDAKFALNRAARAGDQDAIDVAAALAFGWKHPPPDDSALEQLLALHAKRRDNC